VYDLDWGARGDGFAAEGFAEGRVGVLGRCELELRACPENRVSGDAARGRGVLCARVTAGTWRVAFAAGKVGFTSAATTSFKLILGPLVATCQGPEVLLCSSDLVAACAWSKACCCCFLRSFCDNLGAAARAAASFSLWAEISIDSDDFRVVDA